MKICISSCSLDTFGGAERVVVSDAIYFSQKDNEVHILTENLDRDVLSNYGLSDLTNVHPYSLAQTSAVPNVILRAKEIRRWLKRIKPEVVIVHYHEKATWLALRTLRQTPTLISHIHGSVFWFANNINRHVHMDKNCAKEIVKEVPGHSEFFSIGNPPLTQRVHRGFEERLQKVALENFDKIFVNTHQVKRELNCLYNVESTVNPPGIDTRESLTRSEPPCDSQYIFSLSRLEPRKRIDLLINAFEGVASSNPDITLVIGGSGQSRNELEQITKDLDIGDRVDFVGNIPERELHNYYYHAEVFACPGWMSYGITPLEAVRSGTKVALSSDAFVKELIHHQPGVEVFPPNIDAWTSRLPELLNCDETPSADAVPDTRRHSEIKLDSFRSESYGSTSNN